MPGDQNGKKAANLTEIEQKRDIKQGEKAPLFASGFPKKQGERAPLFASGFPTLTGRRDTSLRLVMGSEHGERTPLCASLWAQNRRIYTSLRLVMGLEQGIIHHSAPRYGLGTGYSTPSMPPWVHEEGVVHPACLPGYSREV